MKTRESHRTSLLAVVPLGTTALAFFLAGCHSDPPEETAPTRALVPFEGQADSKYVGDWKSADGSELDLSKDGTLKIVAVAQGPKGKSTNTLNGQWLVSGSNLLLKYAQGSSDVTLKNAATLEGKTLTLVQAGNKHKTVYKLP